LAAVPLPTSRGDCTPRGGTARELWIATRVRNRPPAWVPVSVNRVVLDAARGTRQAGLIDRGNESRSPIAAVRLSHLASMLICQRSRRPDPVFGHRYGLAREFDWRRGCRMIPWRESPSRAFTAAIAHIGAPAGTHPFVIDRVGDVGCRCPMRPANRELTGFAC